MNQYPAKPLMDQMAGYGRYGDSMLVHMNPVEVAGIAALTPGGLTRNPVTGQPEAFAFLAPLLGMAGGALGLGTLGTAALTGVGTAALTGDLKRGILAGLSAGAMSGIGDALAGGTEAATELATQAPDMGAELLAEQSMAGTSGTLGAGIERAMQAPMDVGTYGAQAADTIGGVSQQLAGMPTDYAVEARLAGEAATNALGQQPAATGFQGLSDRLDTAVGNLSFGQAAMLSGIPAGQLAQEEAYDEQRKQARKLEAESEAKLQEAYADLQGGYAAAQPGIQAGVSPYRGMMSRRTPPPFAPGGMAAGGIVSLAEGGTTDASSIEPTEEEARVLALAKTTPALSPPNQRILEGYYNRVNQVAQQNVQTANMPEDAIPLQDGVLKIPDGATNKEALDTLYGYGLISKADYDWFSGHLRATDAEGSKYLASDSFPGINEYLSQNQFDEAQTAQVKRILGALNKASSEEGIAEKDLSYLTEGQITQFSGPYGMYGGYVSGYDGIDPVSVQAALRADYNVAAPMDYMAGFEPEFQYFQQDPNNILVPTRAFRPTKAGIKDTGEYFDPILDREAYLEQLRDYYSRLAGFTPAEPAPTTTTPTTTTPVEAPPVTTTPVTTTPVETPVTTTPATQAPVDVNQQLTFGGSQAATPYESRIAALMSRGMTREQAEANQAYSIRQGYDLNSDGIVTDREYTQAMSGEVDITPQEGGLTQEQIDRNMAYLQQQAAENALTESQANFLTAKTGQDYTGNVADAAAQAEAAAQQQRNMDFLMRQKEAGALTESQAAFLERKGLMAQGGIVSLQEGGPVPMQRVPLQTSMGEMDVAAGGIADMPSNYSKAPQPSQQEVQMLAKAILGRALDPDSIVTAFVERYGPEAFRQIREMVLQSVVPGAQTEGMIRGSGSGMDDQVNGMIGAEQPVAVSPGEYIVPADVVSGLGDGSSDAGAAELDQMLSRVRMARGGNAEQAPAIDAKKTMPA